VTGYVVSVPVTDNQHVKAGDIIAQLDPRDYQTALDQANAQVAVAEANIANVEAQRDVQTAQIAAAKAQVDQAKAALDFAKQQASRYQELAQKGAGSVQNAQQYSSQLGQQDAAVKSAQANEAVAERQLEALKAQLLSAQANLSAAQAQRDQARLNLGYTTVRATEPGRIVQLTAAPGELAQPGTNLTMFVPDDNWIVANFKETQLDRMRPGQPVEFTVDAYPGKTWKAHVASVQPGSGTAFSLLPAQNATGNYVKIVQRVPVKLDIDSAPQDVALGPGMSVVPDVRVDPSPSLWEKLTNWWAAQ
jgi:membrane fusion protein (multidrug efflux system)